MVVVSGRLDTDLHRRAGGEHPANIGDHLRQRRAGHRAPCPGLEQECPGGIGDRERELGLANIDANNAGRRCSASSLNNHGTHLRGCQKATSQQPRPSDEWNLTVPSRHPGGVRE